MNYKQFTNLSKLTVHCIQLISSAESHRHNVLCCLLHTVHFQWCL